MNADKFNKLIDAIKAIETDHNSTKSKLNTVSNQTSTNTSNISNLTTNVNNITNDITSLSNNVTTLNTKIINIENTGSTVTKATIGLGNVDNTSDSSKHVAHAVTSDKCIGNSNTATYADSAGNANSVNNYTITCSTIELIPDSSSLKTNTIYINYE